MASGLVGTAIQPSLCRDGWPTMELVRMVETVPTPVSVGYYGRLVVEAALYRQVEQAGTRLVQAGRGRRGEVDDVFGLIRDECSDLLAVQRRYTEAMASPPPRGGPVPVAALLRDRSALGGVREPSRG